MRSAVERCAGESRKDSGYRDVTEPTSCARAQHRRNTFVFPRGRNLFFHQKLASSSVRAAIDK